MKLTQEVLFCRISEAVKLAVKGLGASKSLPSTVRGLTKHLNQITLSFVKAQSQVLMDAECLELSKVHKKNTNSDLIYLKSIVRDDYVHCA